MRIAVSGASGFIGKALVPFLQNRGHQVFTLVRSDKELAVHEIAWDPAEGYLPSEQLEGFDAVINLSGRSISAYWTDKVKEEIRSSRIDASRLLVKTIDTLKNPPKTFISVSAIGYYGNRGNEELTESSGPGDGFLAKVCKEWEAASATTASRVVNPRLGIVLDKEGGALAKMLTPFRLGLGGVIGSGKQWMSWIALDDLLEIFDLALNNPALVGPVNAVSPDPVTNREFTKTLGKVLHRPTFFSMPDYVARFILGEMADEMLLTSDRVIPEKLNGANFNFHFRNLNDTLESFLKSS